MDQSMSGRSADLRINAEAKEFAALLAGDNWSLQCAHERLTEACTKGNMSMYQIAGLAKAIVCFQCSADEQ